MSVHLSTVCSERQIDVQRDRLRAGVVRAVIGGLHRAGAAPRDDREAGLAEPPPDVARQVVRGRAGGVRAEPKTDTARCTPASAAKPLDSSAAIRSTRVVSLISLAIRACGEAPRRASGGVGHAGELSPRARARPPDDGRDTRRSAAAA